jgi:hypothetical protein
MTQGIKKNLATYWRSRDHHLDINSDPNAAHVPLAAYSIIILYILA